jgi:hypothetical protein
MSGVLPEEGERGGAPRQSDQAAQLMDLLGLTEDELCQILDVDPLSLISGQLEHATQLPILLDLLAEPGERVGKPVLQRWVRASGPKGTPIDALLNRDFAAFENALVELEQRGFVLKPPEAEP